MREIRIAFVAVFRRLCSATTAGQKRKSLAGGSLETFFSRHEAHTRGPLGPPHSVTLLGDPPVGDGRLSIHTLAADAFALELDLALMLSNFSTSKGYDNGSV